MRSERTTLIAWAFLAPALLYVLAIVAWPLVQTVILSFTDASLRKTTDWVGSANYEKIFNATFATVIVRNWPSNRCCGTDRCARRNARPPGTP